MAFANTQLTDVFIPSVYSSYTTVNSTEKTAFAQSGVAVTAPLFDQLASGPGQITTMPFWKDLDSSIEPNYSNDVYTDIAEPQKVVAGTQVARIANLNEGFSSADLVTILSGEEPLKHVAARIDAYWQKQFQRRLLASAIGVYNDNVADNTGDMVVNISVTTGTPTVDNQFNANTFVDAAMTSGDNLDTYVAIAVHSIVYGNMVKNNLIDFIPDSEGKLTIPTYFGKRVIMDDGMPTFGTGITRQYVSILFGAGAFGYGAGSPKVPEEVVRYPERANGGGIEVLWSRKDWVIHPFGYKWLETTVTGPGYTPTWADLKLATNWARVIERKLIPMAFIVTNG
jgi:hypothetical protein